MAARDPNDPLDNNCQDETLSDGNRYCSHTDVPPFGSTLPYDESRRVCWNTNADRTSALSLSQSEFIQYQCLDVQFEDPDWLERALQQDESLILVGETSLSSYVSRLLCSTLGHEASRTTLRKQHDLLLSHTACITYAQALDVPRMMKYPCFSDYTPTEEDEQLRVFFALLGAMTMDKTPTTLYKYLEEWLETKIDEQQLTTIS